MINQLTDEITVLIILNGIAIILNLFFLIIKTKDHVQAKKHKNKKEKRLHNQPWRYPSVKNHNQTERLQFNKWKEFLNQQTNKK